MDSYINSYDSFTKIVVYNYDIGSGGIADCVKYFMFILELCIKNNTRLYYKRNDIELEKYIKLKYTDMYFDNYIFKHDECIEHVTPQMYYSLFNYDNLIMDINEVFYITDDVKINSRTIFPLNINAYISIHLRMGDKYLETDSQYIVCKDDIRQFSEQKIDDFIKENTSKTIFCCCDNNNCKLKIKEKYNNVIVSSCEIGHVSLFNTTKKQVLDAVTEFYLLTRSEMIFAATESGFSRMASRFGKIPLIHMIL